MDICIGFTCSYSTAYAPLFVPHYNFSVVTNTLDDHVAYISTYFTLLSVSEARLVYVRVQFHCWITCGACVTATITVRRPHSE
jgi:hypothetical protein